MVTIILLWIFGGMVSIRWGPTYHVWITEPWALLAHAEYYSIPCKSLLGGSSNSSISIGVALLVLSRMHFARLSFDAFLRGRILNISQHINLYLVIKFSLASLDIIQESLHLEVSYPNQALQYEVNL